MKKEQNMLELIKEIATKQPGKVEYPMKIQLDNLNLNKSKIRVLEGKKVLIPACGCDGKLVEYLRERDVIAEGIDPTLERETDYLIRKGIAVGYSGNGSIPREKEHYDAIYAHAFAQISYPFSGLKVRQDMWGTPLEGSLILMELLRVLKKGGQIVSYPGMPNLSIESLGIGAPQVELKEEVAFPDLEKVLRIKDESPNIPEIELLKRYIKNRTIITKL